MLDVPQCLWGIARVKPPTVKWPSSREGRGQTLTPLNMDTERKCWRRLFVNQKPPNQTKALTKAKMKYSLEKQSLLSTLENFSEMC